MNLSPTECEQFYRIWWPLLNYVNRQKNLVADFPESPKFGSIDPQDAIVIRNALWESDELLNAFIAANPGHLSEEDLALAASWKWRLTGRFIVMKHLKKYSVLLSQDSPPTAFGVLGIVSSLQEILPFAPPVMVDAVLLPFGGKIIFDSLIFPYNVGFGGGYRRSFSHNVRLAEERAGIITTLDPDLQAKAVDAAVIAGNRKILAAFRKALAKDGLSEKMQQHHGANIEAFVNERFSQATPPRSLLDLEVADLESYFKALDSHVNRVSFKRLLKFLFESERIDWEQGASMDRFLKTR
ncbi:MAG: hypothetical protein ACU837_16245 [Gammaproteobacteria bacterium]